MNQPFHGERDSVLGQRMLTLRTSIRVRCIPTRRLKPLPWPLPVYTLTRICLMEYTKKVETVFEIVKTKRRRRGPNRERDKGETQ
jgi:hypothetical protein